MNGACARGDRDRERSMRRAEVEDRLKVESHNAFQDGNGAQLRYISSRPASEDGRVGEDGLVTGNDWPLIGHI